MKFDFGTWIIENNTLVWSSLVYEVCGCEDIYSFKQDSTLLAYLRDNCPGWVSNPYNRYTLKYIIFVIVSHSRAMRILKKNGPFFMFTRQNDEGLAFSRALDPSITGAAFYLDSLRPLIEKLHLVRTFIICLPFEYLPKFICSTNIRPWLVYLLLPRFDYYDLNVRVPCYRRPFVDCVKENEFQFRRIVHEKWNSLL